MILRPLLIVTALLLAAPNFIDKDINKQFTYDHRERYNPNLAPINSIDKLESYVDRAARLNDIKPISPLYNLLLSYIISCRFYHGFSHWKLNENWIAAVSDKITGMGMSCKVQPEAIMKNPDAGCSQQVLVMMEILRRKNIDYRKVGFPHHYAIEVRTNGGWYYFDPNMEPNMNISQRLHENWKESNDSLKKYYVAKHDHLSNQFGAFTKAEFGPINEVPAFKLRWFQNITSVLSKIIWCLPLLVLFAKRRSIKKIPVKPMKHSLHPSNLNPSFSA